MRESSNFQEKLSPFASIVKEFTISSDTVGTIPTRFLRGIEFLEFCYCMASFTRFNLKLPEIQCLLMIQGTINRENLWKRWIYLASLPLHEQERKSDDDLNASYYLYLNLQHAEIFHNHHRMLTWIGQYLSLISPIRGMIESLEENRFVRFDTKNAL